jgi:hypothetical protein
VSRAESVGSELGVRGDVSVGLYVFVARAELEREALDESDREVRAVALWRAEPLGLPLAVIAADTESGPLLRPEREAVTCPLLLSSAERLVVALVVELLEVAGLIEERMVDDTVDEGLGDDDDEGELEVLPLPLRDFVCHEDVELEGVAVP